MPRTTLAYDDIIGFSQTVPDTTEGDLYTAVRMLSFYFHFFIFQNCVYTCN